MQQDEKLESLVTDCLLNEKLEFLEILVLSGFSINRYLRVEKLRMLYREVVRIRTTVELSHPNTNCTIQLYSTFNCNAHTEWA